MLRSFIYNTACVNQRVGGGGGVFGPFKTPICRAHATSFFLCMTQVSHLFLINLHHAANYISNIYTYTHYFCPSKYNHLLFNLDQLYNINKLFTKRTNNQICGMCSKSNHRLMLGHLTYTQYPEFKWLSLIMCLIGAHTCVCVHVQFLPS